MLVRVLTSTLAGIDALLVEVETDISQGLPSCTVCDLQKLSLSGQQLFGVA